MPQITTRVFPSASVESTPVAGKGATRAMLLGPQETPNFQMRKFTIEPGGSIPAHTNSVEHEQYVLSGTARIGIGGEVHEVSAGDVIFIPAGVPHWYETTGDAPYVFLCLGPNGEDRIEMAETG